MIKIIFYEKPFGKPFAKRHLSENRVTTYLNPFIFPKDVLSDFEVKMLLMMQSAHNFNDSIILLAITKMYTF